MAVCPSLNARLNGWLRGCDGNTRPRAGDGAGSEVAAAFSVHRERDRMKERVLEEFHIRRSDLGRASTRSKGSQKVFFFSLSSHADSLR